MIHALSDTVRLNNGLAMPGYGFGCYKITDENEAVTAVRAALDCGYRYIDTAAYYKNENAVGRAVRDSGIPREKLFVLSKVWPTFFENPLESLHESLRLLNMEYLDGFLLHWPGISRDKRLHAFECLLRETERGTIRALGVSNFLQIHLEELHQTFGLWPTQNQIEIHPSFPQRALCAFCKKRDIQVVSWAPMGRGKTLDNPIVRELAARLGKSCCAGIWNAACCPFPNPPHQSASARTRRFSIFSWTPPPWPCWTRWSCRASPGAPAPIP